MKKERKVVVDTNVFVSLLIGKSKTLSQIYESFLDGGFTPVLSLPMHLEILAVVNRPKFNRYFKPEEVERFKELLNTDTILVTPIHKVHICRDPKDNLVLESALEAKADFVVTGDKDLLSLKSFHGIPIIKPKEFLNRLRK